MNNIYNSVRGNHPRLNKFDWSYSNTFSASIGYLYPVQCDVVYPGSIIKTNNYIHAEIMPLVAPLMADLNIYVHQFFVPFRLLYGVDSDGKNIWEQYISGGEDGTYNTPLPSWNPSATSTDFSSKLIWDYCGLPMAKDDTVITPTQPYPEWSAIVPAGIQVMDFAKRAYNLIYNEYYRDEFHIQELDIANNEYLQRVSFRKDYFTSAIDNPVLGPVSALPLNLSGILPVNWSAYAGTADSGQVSGFPYGKLLPKDNAIDVLTLSFSGNNTVADGATNTATNASGVKGSIDASGITSTTFDVNELRFSFAVQRLLELSAISGVRYTEFLTAHFGVSPTDARLDRPEYIGGCINGIQINSSVQHSESSATSVQGKKVGIGSLDQINHIGNYRVYEHGVVMTMLSIRPKPIYKTGVPRQFLNKDGRYSFYFPEFAFLGEQPIYNCEVYTDPTAVDSAGDKLDPQIFGYQSAWNYLRSKQNMVSGAVREQFKYWTLAREFANHPALNKDFLEVVDTDFNQAFAVQDEDEFIINYSNLAVAYLPLPAFSNPGLIDHVYGQ